MSDRFAGIVLKAIRGHFWVEAHETVFRCVARDVLVKSVKSSTAITVGDHVLFDVQDWQHKQGIIVEVLPRRTKLSRKRQADSYDVVAQEDVVAANIDQVVIVASAHNPPLRPGLIDRYLVASLKGGLSPIICINKIDLSTLAEVRPIAELYDRLNYPVLMTCAKSGQGVDDLRRHLSGRASVFAGHSGVGKTTLLKQLCPGIEVKTQEVSNKTGRGKHTTTNAELVRLPSGGYVIDTPGIRQFSLWDLTPEDIASYFVEIAEHSRACRFRDCSHTVEPDCAVRQTLQQGLIHPLRYESYLKLLQECKDEKSY